MRSVNHRQPSPRFVTHAVGPLACAALCAGLASAAFAPEAIAQVIVPGINAPALVPFPSPPIQMPQVPGPTVLPQPTLAAPQFQTTFPDRVSACLQTGGAAGLGGADLDAYTRECANQ